MKDDPVKSWFYRPGTEYTKSNPLHGSAILVHSIPADKLAVNELSAITANIGSVFAGNMTIGDPAGSRVVIGDNVDGFSCFDSAGRTVLRWSNTNAALSIGVSDFGTRLMYTSGTRLYIHGDALITGTVTVGALKVGPLATVFLDEDEIRVGAGTVGTDFDGFRISQNEIGGYSNGSLRFQVDPDDGRLVSKATADTYVELADGKIRLVTLSSDLDNKAEISFLDSYFNIQTDVNFVQGQLEFVNRANDELSRAPTIVLRAGANNAITLSPYNISVYNRSGKTVSLRSILGGDWSVESGVIETYGDDMDIIFDPGTSAKERVFVRYYDTYTAFQVSSDGRIGVALDDDPTAGVDINESIVMRSIPEPAVSATETLRAFFDSTANKWRASENTGAYSNVMPYYGRSAMTGADLDLTDAYQDVAGCTATLTIPTGGLRVVVRAIADVVIGSTPKTVVVALNADTSVQSQTGQFAGANGDRGTICQEWIVDLAEGEKVIKLQAKEATADGVGNLIDSDNTQMVYILGVATS
jgi:hypothetical protein